MSKAKAAQAQIDRDLRSTSFELGQMLHKRQVAATILTTSELRDAILKKLAPADKPEWPPFYDQAAMELIGQFEAALRADWERIEVSKVRREAERAIAEALGLPTQWRLL